MVTFSIQEGFAEAGASTGVAPFDTALRLLQDFGFFRVVLPFLLIFGITYAILIKTNVLGSTDNPVGKNIAGVIAAVAGFFFVVYTPVVDALAVLLPQASFLLVLALLVLMTLAFVIPDYEEKAKGAPSWALGALAVLVILVFLGITGFAVGDNIPILRDFSLALTGQVNLPELPQEAIDNLLAIGIVLILPLLIIWFMTRSGGAATQQGFKIMPNKH